MAVRPFDPATQRMLLKPILDRILPVTRPTRPERPIAASRWSCSNPAQKW